MRLRLLIGSLVAGTLLLLAAPASAEPQKFGTCKVNLLSAEAGDGGVTVPDGSNVIECYY